MIFGEKKSKGKGPCSCVGRYKLQQEQGQSGQDPGMQAQQGVAACSPQPKPQANALPKSRAQTHGLHSENPMWKHLEQWPPWHLLKPEHSVWADMATNENF
jgi:hypothetical protein